MTNAWKRCPDFRKWTKIMLISSVAVGIVSSFIPSFITDPKKQMMAKGMISAPVLISGVKTAIEYFNCKK